MSTQALIPPTSPRLGEYLSCGAEAIDDAVNVQADPPDDWEYQRIGAVLLEAHAITLDDLLSALERQRVDRLKACPLFSSLEESELVDLSVIFQEVSVIPGEQFITEGDRDPSVFVLASGRLEVFKTDDQGAELHLAAVFPGEPVGETGYFSDGVQVASVRARETSQLLRASYEDLTACFEHIPEVAAAFLDVVTQRLRKTNLLYQERESQEKPAERALSHLAEFLELSKARDLGEGIDGLIERLVLSASRLTDADRATLFLIDPETGEMWSKVAEGMETREIRVPAGAGVVGWVCQEGKMLNIVDAYEDERFNPEVDRRTGYKTTSILCGPVKGLKGEVLGAVQVINKQLGVFTEDDEMLLRAFGDQAAVALDNINRYREVVNSHERMSSMLALVTAMSEAPDVAGLMHAVGAKIMALLGCAHGALLLLDEPKGVLWSAFADSAGGRRFSMPAGASLAGHSLSSGEAVRVADAYEDSRFDRDLDPTPGERTRSFLCAPMLDRRGKIVGVLNATNKIDGVFDEDDLELIQAMAAQVGRSGLLDT